VYLQAIFWFHDHEVEQRKSTGSWINPILMLTTGIVSELLKTNQPSNFMISGKL
jgi:hypothetical protein